MTDQVVNQTPMPRGLAAVVVHHRSLHTVLRTLHSLIESDVSSTRILLVDNSESEADINWLMARAPRGVVVHTVRNRGYAAAVNWGLDFVRQFWAETQFVLVATHELQLASNALSELIAFIARDPGVGAVGPALRDENGAVWSNGGFLSSVLRIPNHLDHMATEVAVTRPKEVDWLDGACVLYRMSAISGLRMHEEYFLYMEEVDFHLQLKRAGHSVFVVPCAVAIQSSTGIPDFFLARNTRIFQRRNGTRVSRALTPPTVVVRRVGRYLVGRRGKKPDISQLMRGFMNRNRYRSGDKHNTLSSVVIVNPLGRALRQYREALSDTINGLGYATHVHEWCEPSADGSSRLMWVLRHFRVLYSTSRRFNEFQIVIWPALGYLDAVFLRLIAAPRSYVIIHDPVPLVRSAGYGKIARSLARLLAGSKLLVHSSEALRAMPGRGSDSTELPHPFRRSPDDDGKPESGQILPERVRILVFGQFKKDRNIELLEELAGGLPGEYDLLIVGRGWPPVRKWTVVDTFVPECEVDRLLRSASVVLIPYTRFYQSGVAIRCLENNVPFVGPKNSSLKSLVGSDSSLLAGSSHADWLCSIDYAIRDGRAEARRASISYESSTRAAWSLWFNDAR